MTAAFKVVEGIDAGAKVVPLDGAADRLERAVLGTLAAAPEDVAGPALAALDEGDFSAPGRAAFFRALSALHELGEPATAAALAVELEHQGAAAAYREAAFIDRIITSAEAPAALAGHVARMKDAAARRRASAEMYEVGRAVESGAPAARVAEQLAAAAGATLDASRWPDPVPLGVALPPAWPRDILGGPFARMVHTIAASYQVPLDLPASLGLGVLAAAVGGRVQVRARRGWREPLSLFLAAAMPPASRKSAAVRAMGFPLVEWERRELERVGHDVEDSSSALRVAEKSLARAEEAVGRAKDDEAKEKAEEWRRRCVAELASARANLVRPPRIVTDDATPEALTSLLAEHGGRFAVMSAEGGGLFDMMAGRYSSGVNLDVYLKGHAGDVIRVDRKGRPPEYVRDPALTVAVATQPDTFKVLASRPELRGRGLPARFLYSVPTSNIGFREVDPPPPDPEAVRGWGELVRELLNVACAEGEDGRRTPRTLTLDEGAAVVLDAFAGVIETRLRPGQDLGELADWGGKLVGAAVRIAGLLHLAEHDWSSPVAPWEVGISESAMERAVWLASEYFVPHARVAFQTMGDTPGVEGARRLLSWIARRGRASFTSREALRALNRNGTRREVVDPALDVLVAHGWIREDSREDKRPGRPSDRYHCHPAALAR